jgi:23S rRNA pseudouridine2605 synthase
MSDETKPEIREGSRIAKVMARAGLCSRRDAEAWIAAGRVSVNGEVLLSPAYNVSDADDVRVDGQRLGAPERTRLFLFHKPRGLVTTARDPEGRPTIFDALPPDLPRVVAIGRLDINTEGLLLLTNDGGLARVLELPATGWLRRYRVRAHGHIDQAKLDSLSGGISLDGVDYAGIEAKLDREQGSNAWITMGLREGKNREIKKVLEHLGLAVNRLIRVSFGPFELGDLAEGEVAEVRTRVLRDQLGAKLAREAGVDFDAPLVERSAPAQEPREEPRLDDRRREEPGRREGPGRGRLPQPRRGGSDQRQEKPIARNDAPPRRVPPAPSTPERRRKHISALRAEIVAEATAAARSRKRIERSSTHDRKGRTVAVERLTPTAAELAKRAAAEPRERGRAGARGPGREAGERPRRAGSFDPRRTRDGEGREDTPRSESKSRGSRSEKHSSRGDGAPRGRRFDRAEGGRQPRRFEGGGPGAAGPGREKSPSPDFKPRGPRAGGDDGKRERRFDRPDARPARDRPPGAGAPDKAPRARKFDRPQGEGPRASSSGREKSPHHDFKPHGPRVGGDDGKRERRFDRPDARPARDRPPSARAPDKAPRARKFDRPQGERRDKGGESRPPRSGAGSSGRPAGRPPDKGPAKGPSGGPRRPPRKP